MHTLIFSDTHLTHHFEPAKFAWLLSKIDAADKVIINGDLWDFYLTDWDRFLASEWSRLFPVLKSKKAVYLYGNHDPHAYADERVNLFSVDQAQFYEMTVGDTILHIEHGHLISPRIGDVVPVLHNQLGLGLLDKLEELSVKALGRSFFQYYAYMNQRMKNYAASSAFPHDTILICGHSHLAELSLEQKYINGGVIRYGIGQCVVVNDDRVMVVDEKYR